MFFIRLKLTAFLFLSLISDKFGRILKDKVIYQSDLLNNHKAIENVYKNYKITLKKIKQKVKNHQKIKVGFFVSENAKWSCQSLYDELLESEFFEPVIIVAKANLYSSLPDEFSDKIFDNTIDFFKNKNMNYVLGYSVEKKKHINLKRFELDVVFYQQPWQTSELQNIFSVSDSTLSCYVPYCFHMLDSKNNYFPNFHAYFWKYFTESDIYTKKYRHDFGVKNCITTGHPKLDNYKFVESVEKENTKKTIIYAPHHSVGHSHMFSTFNKNCYFILDLAKKYKDINWIFKPHPGLVYCIVSNNFMTKEELDNYYQEWENLDNATVYTKGDYYHLFKNSDGMITDCISFLAEYLPSEKPVLQLVSSNVRENYSKLGELITRYYYKIKSNEELDAEFKRVIIEGDDYLKEKRLNSIKYLEIQKEKTNASKIVDYFKKEFEIYE